MESLLTVCGSLRDASFALCGQTEQTAATILRPDKSSVLNVG
jgi:hypothetical protein